MLIDKMYSKVTENGPVCVGLDTDISYIPESFKLKYENDQEAVLAFNKAIINATYDVAACFKVQIAYYEAYGIQGLIAYKKTIEYAKSKGCIVISDIKRGDIAKTAEMYAKAHFEGDFESDFITLNPYMGMDSIGPYLKYVEKFEKGLFILMRTSNPGAKDIQFQKNTEGNTIYNEVGKSIREIGNKYIGDCKYSSIGAVVGCTHKEEAENIRKSYPELFFLIPGYGAQGGAKETVAACLGKSGRGGVVNSSRNILLAYKGKEEGKFAEYARCEVLRMRGEILSAIN